MSSATELFEDELRRRGLAFTRNADGRYGLEVASGKLEISIEHVARDFARDGDPGRITRFVGSVLDSLADLPEWSGARDAIYWSAEPADIEVGDTIHEAVTDTVVRVLVHMATDEGRVTWLTHKSVANWGVDLDDVKAAADAGLDRLLADKQLEVATARDRKLGMIPVSSLLKASTIFAPAFKQFVVAELGWPVLAVIPCRDFAYVIAESDRDLLGAMGSVVQREFRESGYPITTEVLHISDDGIEAIGAYPR